MSQFEIQFRQWTKLQLQFHCHGNSLHYCQQTIWWIRPNVQQELSWASSTHRQTLHQGANILVRCQMSDVKQTSIVFRRKLFSGIRLAIVRSYVISIKKNFQYLLIVAVLSVANMLGGGRQLLDIGWSWGQEVTECYFYNSQWQQSCVLADLQQ